MKGLKTSLVALSSVLATTTFSAPNTINSFEQLVQALRQGDSVHAIISIDKCTLKPPMTKAGPPVDLTGAFSRMKFDVVNYYKVPVSSTEQRYAVATSATMLVEHRAFGFVYGYARVRVFDNNMADFHIAQYDPKTFEQKTQMDFTCPVNTGITLFDESV